MLSSLGYPIAHPREINAAKISIIPEMFSYSKKTLVIEIYFKGYIYNLIYYISIYKLIF
jgi:hypothetical protein